MWTISSSDHTKAFVIDDGASAFNVDSSPVPPDTDTTVGQNVAMKVTFPVSESTLRDMTGRVLSTIGDSSKTNDTKERLSILNKSNDGFYIASEDLKLRGPGDLFGIRQSGVLDFKMADVFQDAKILQRASEAAAQLMKRDPYLESEENQNLKNYLNFYIKEGLLETTL